MSKPLGLYIHVPFCKQKCVYCDFYSLPRREEDMDAYAAALRAQLFETDFSGYEADTVYFGGGTPSYLGPRRLAALLEAVSTACPIAPGAEITFEANPDSASDSGDLAALRRAGFNRVSLGMQSADDGELKSIGRVHTMAQVRSAVEAVRRAGFDNLSLDLIYGLPGQSLPRWRENLSAAAALCPEHLSCYGLKAEPGTPLYARRDALPGDGAQADMYLEAVDFLEARGWRQYEISNFAKPRRESRHNLKYWTLGEYAGFGPGAHSDLGDVRYACVRDLDAYCLGVEAQGDILSENERIPPRERDVEYLMLGLRLAKGVSRQEFEYRFRLPFSPVQEVLERFEQSGHAVLRGGRWRLTPEGFLLSNQIIGQALEALAGEKLRREEAAARHDYRVR